MSKFSFDKVEVSVYPNPVQSIINFSGLTSPVKATVFDMLGKRLLQAEVTNSLELGHLKSGIYMLKIKSENSSKIFNIVKQ